jgi:RHH-type transcriptional regulator, proline utilization regulon repressor / proline dehydrogenase / delta 1-pyrroline-5-carboxylate dehydrogenase
MSGQVAHEPHAETAGHAGFAPLDSFTPAQRAEIDRETEQIGLQIFASLRDVRPNFWDRRWLDDRLLAWTMRDERVKVELFRFVDALPMLRTSDEVIGHLHEYLGRVRDRLPGSIRTALGLARRTPGVRGAVAKAVQMGAKDFARRFIAGANAPEVLAAALRERQRTRAFTLDILGEAVITDREAEEHTRAYIELIEAVSPTVNAEPEISQIDRDARGDLPRVNVSIKLSALDAMFDPIDPAGVLDRAGSRLREILRVAGRHGAFINVDMESYEKKDLTLYLVRTVLSEPEFGARDDVGIVIQCYLRDSADDIVALRDFAAERGTPLWVRLVKGAYWDYETVHAQASGWPIPVYQRKAESDINFERVTRFVMQNAQHLRPAIGSHNIRSIAHAIATARHLGLDPLDFELQMLYGMADAEKQALVEMGHRLRIYMPFGELIPGMAYLVRRLLENTSNDSFLRAGFVEKRSPQELMRNPAELLAVSDTPKADAASPPASESDMSQPKLAATFQNQPPVDFARAENRERMQRALEQVREELGVHRPLVIDGDEIDTEERITSLDPSQFDRVVGTCAMAGAEHVDQAVKAALRALPSWRGYGAQTRANYLRRAADHMHRRLFELAAWEVYECGKTWREATADIDEAIDFLRYYAEQAILLERPQGADVPGEENRFEYFPRGVVGVIAPWNFPLAILTGMTAAALATGNTVVMKPAEQSPIMAAHLMQVLADSGVPPGVANYLPGDGAVAGAALVEHPEVAMIVFTGSRPVGLAINRRAAETSAHAPQVKRVVAEMGGKNAIIVDADADLDEAVLGVVHSALGFQGQKCSACSRVIALDGIYEPFVARLVEAARSFKVGPAEEPGTDIGPVIDADALANVQRYIEIGRREGREVLAVDVGPLRERGYFVGPHLFADVSPECCIAQEEVFGPVVAITRAKDFDDALRIANQSEYALTGGVFSRSPVNLDRARREFLVGNLYLNRSITGAIVGRHPFGGFKMSGIGSKAGGPDYLLQFVLPRVITENTLRRGFAPQE